MPRSPKIPAHSLHKPSGRAVVKVTEEGKRRSIYLGEYGSDESRESYARVIADIMAGRKVRQLMREWANPTPVPSLTVGQLVERFEKHTY